MTILADILSLIHMNLMQPPDEVKLNLRKWMNNGAFGILQTLMAAWMAIYRKSSVQSRKNS